MKRFVSIILLLGLMASMVGCGNQTADKPQSAGTDTLSTPNGDYADMVLSKSDILSDYDAMWLAVKESYPFWGVLARSHPEEPDYYNTVIEKYRKQLEDMEETGDDAMIVYIMTVANSLYDVCGRIGHVSIINLNYFEGLSVYQKYLDEMPEVQPWVDVIERTEVINFYKYYEYLLPLMIEKENEEMVDSEEVPVTASMPEDAEEPEENLTTEILEQGRTAYIRVNSFEDAFMEDDLPKIRAFLEEVGGYEHLIIDIQNNGGGNTEYWENAFVRPNISQTITSRYVRLMPDTPLARQFYGNDYDASSLTMEDVMTDPKFTALPKEDMRRLSLARKLTAPLEPETGERLFEGNVWVLVGPAVYSSAEAFAVFCKDTGFATLVGETTGGADSGGPILFELPKSHLLIQFDVEYCLNADGSCNQEMGTKPDIESDNSLQTVLDLINAQ